MSHCQKLRLTAANPLARFLATAESALCNYATVTVLDIIHRPVFYLKLNSTLQVRPFLTGNTLRHRYDPPLLRGGKATEARS
jgi:hypothetical protein